MPDDSRPFHGKKIPLTWLRTHFLSVPCQKRERFGPCRRPCTCDGWAADVTELWHVAAGKAHFGRPIWRLPDQAVPSTERGGRHKNQGFEATSLHRVWKAVPCTKKRPDMFKEVRLQDQAKLQARAAKEPGRVRSCSGREPPIQAVRWVCS